MSQSTTPGDADSVFKISQPGSYYLTSNVTGVAFKHGIEIAASGVTLDLNGFDVVGIPGMGSFSGVSVTVASLSNITLLNGSIRGWGGDGVDFGNFLATHTRIDGVTSIENVGDGIHGGRQSSVTSCFVSSNGARGIRVSQSSIVAYCTSGGNGDIGISAGERSLIYHCTSTENGAAGFNIGSSGILDSCTAASNTGAGINAGAMGRVSNCVAVSNSQNGIQVGDGSTVVDSTAGLNGFDGIRVFSYCRVVNNTCNDNGAAGLFSGIWANGSYNRIEGNHVTNFSVTDGGISVSVGGSGNFIVRNYVHGSGANNYLIPSPNNFVGTIVAAGGTLNSAANANVNVSN